MKHVIESVLYIEKQEKLANLRRLSTRQLMNWLRLSHRYHGQYETGGLVYSTEDIKDILKYRPHVPNKKEGKAIRRAKAQGRA